MNGGFLSDFKTAFELRVTLFMIFNGMCVGAVAYYIFEKLKIDSNLAVGLLLSATLVFGAVISKLLSNILIKPLSHIAQAIFHISPNEHFASAPNNDKLGLGKELVNNLTRQIYDYASVSQNLSMSGQNKNNPEANSSDFLLDQIPVGVIGLDSSGNIAYINKVASSSFKLENPIGLSLDSQIQVKYSGNDLKTWVEESKNQSINSTKIWHKLDVSTGSGSDQVRTYYDIAASYRQGQSKGIEVILVFIPNEDLFRIEEEALNIISLSVHEIRTPLTIMRGYVDALREDLKGKLSDQDQQFFDRLYASAQNLTTYMHNVLNVVKYDQNQLFFPLEERSWKEDLTRIVSHLEERAKTRNKKIELNIPDDLPPVAVNKASIGEVLSNLVENAIKYSPSSDTIWIDVEKDKSDMIVTTIKDNGVGIPSSVVPDLFTKFHRNHRNSKAISGTGLGLFICKAIVSAHHGNIWVKSAEGKGTSVSFSLLPYTKLAEVEDLQKQGVSVVGHGWIKNHSMQRR